MKLDSLKSLRAIERRKHLLLAVTSLVLAYVRTFLQYGNYLWDSVFDFAASWFVHYLALGLAAAVFYGLTPWAWRSFIAEGEPIKLNEALVYFCLAVLIGCGSVFVIAHWPAGYSLEE